MAYCPNCNVVIAPDAEDCDVCGTSFGADTWLPLDSLPAPARRPSGLRMALLVGMGVAVLGLAWLGLQARL